LQDRDENQNIALSDEDLTKLAGEIAKKLVVINKSKETEKKEINPTWIAGDLYFHCRPCEKYKDSLKVPFSLQKFRRGDFSLVMRNQSKSHMRQAMTRHESNDLHIYCVVQEKEDEKGRQDVEALEKHCGEQVIRNVLHCIKHGQSAEDLVALNNLNHLNSKNPAAVKNNSRQIFFVVREECFELLSEMTKDFFGPDGGVDNICVSLDKVTSNHASYTVLVTYFFFNGRLLVILNELALLDEDSYCSAGTARAIVASLRKTLGVTRNRLAKILRHFSYDGVYATKEQRTGGGGSLNLIHFVAAELDLEEGDITGHWDTAHLLQVIWNRVLTEEESVLRLLNIYFKAMDANRLGKHATIFENKARMIGNLVLKNKHYLTTRFVRSLVLGMRSALQNLPTLIAIVAEEYNAAALDSRNADAVAPKKVLENLRSSRNLVKTIGIMQILEQYCKTSLTGQSSSMFPSQVFGCIIESQEVLQSLSQKWRWEEKDLKFSCLEAPTKIIQRLLEEGVYRPKVKRENVRNYKDLIEAGLLQEGEKIDDLFEDDEPVQPLAGESPMEPISQEDVDDIEAELELIAGSLVDTWRERDVGSDHDMTVHKAFGSYHNDVPPPLNAADKRSDEKRVRDMMKGLLSDILVLLPRTQQDQFVVMELMSGFMGFNWFWSKKQEEAEVKDPNVVLQAHDIYEEWYKDKVMKDSENQYINISFSKFFENLQVRSCSEVRTIITSIVTFRFLTELYCLLGYLRNSRQHNEK
jgi:hypothetical protein